MTRSLPFLLLLIFLACADNNNNSPSTVKLGAFMCGKTANEMAWLRTLVQRSETDMAMRGDIYAGVVEGRVLFIHQPMVMSCLACIIYDCDGNKIESSTLDHEKLRLIMGPENRIYNAH